MRWHERRPSPAVVLAILALIAAVAGTAIADPLATKTVITRKKTKKLANKVVTNRLNGVTVQQAIVPVGANSSGGATATCPAGQHALGGGGGGPINTDVATSVPGTGTGPPLASGQGFSSWHVFARNDNASQINLFAYVICAP